MGNHRKISRIIEPQWVTEGAGVKLRRSIATRELNTVDPFPLFDHFKSDNPDDYLAGFPMHPHRGIETVTYMLEGQVNHKDSIGNAGTIQAGDVQWMTSGRGILHEEMPQSKDGKMDGFQLWVNLPAKLKMTEPNYQEILSDQIPEVHREDGVKIRVIAGTVDGVQSSVTAIAADPIYIDVSIPSGASFTHPVERGHNAVAYVFEGGGRFGGEEVPATKLIVFDDGDSVNVESVGQPVRFLLLSGKPFNEPMARYGPFVMNTRAEIEQTLEELRNGTFVR